MTDNANPPADKAVVVDEQPPSLEEMRATVKLHHERVARLLGEKRAAREKLNLEIAQLVAQKTETERLVRAPGPRKARK